MELFLPFAFHATTLFLLFFLLLPYQSFADCRNQCGTILIRYPFGTGLGCGSPRFFPSVTCTNATITTNSSSTNTEEILTFTTHTGTYPITSISYDTNTLTIFPPLMSTCNYIHPSSPPLGLDWAAPFQLGPSLFALLACGTTAATQSYCDPSPSGARLCASLSSCPALGLPASSATDISSCCAFAPASALGPHDDLDLHTLGCGAYTSVLSFGPIPTDPNMWEYGVALRYEPPTDDPAAEVCAECEASGGICGYTPPENYFVCVCANSLNTSTDCTNLDRAAFKDYWRNTATVVHGLKYLKLMVVVLLIVRSF